jgi:molybdate transport system substrate-binding protein
MWILALAGCGRPAVAPPPPPPPPLPAPVELTALAAASLTDVLPTVAAAWKAADGADVVFSFDSSSKLAKQVEGGAPADLVFFADTDTMNSLDTKNLLAAGSRRDLLGNELVVVVPATATWTPASAADLSADALHHLALAGENVPAGRYGRAALNAANVWMSVEPKVVTGDNVRTTLAWVTRGEAEAGVVYATDAKAEPGVKTAFVFPADAHPPIVYPAAVVASSTHVDQAKIFLDFCASPIGMELFAKAGFLPPPPPK